MAKQCFFFFERMMAIPMHHTQENAIQKGNPNFGIIEVRAPLNLAQDYTLNRPTPGVLKEIQTEVQKAGIPVFSTTTFQFGGHNSLAFEILL